jgi:hypothetical protein
MTLGVQVVWLLLLALPIASISWTVTHEEIFHEPREYCARKSHDCPHVLERKLFFIVTCEFCFSHYITIAFLFLTRYHLLFEDWRGYVLALFALVWLANFYMAVFARLQLGIKSQRIEISQEEQKLHEQEAEPRYS